ncbi:hypothetical protein [Elizabethkingia meningoseptica]|uniref:hypothetical protein n=1 Tax=Elizabethkingia meningoseptica TaxID=238 RepID=UPI001629AADD|nr:hypothetical protein [Elizabethkingia meningoseptica]HAY3553783.1 hypothetical protein [Elizabethkingia meningoseptica]
MLEEKIIACATYVTGIVLIFNPAPELKYIGGIITVTLMVVGIPVVYELAKTFVSKRKRFKNAK